MRSYESNFASFYNLFSLSLFVFPFRPVLLNALSPSDNSCIVLSSSVTQITGDACLPHWILTGVAYWISAHVLIAKSALQNLKQHPQHECSQPESSSEGLDMIITSNLA